MQPIAESELIINSRGAVYHLNLTPNELANNIITVGDPDRVNEVSKHFDSIEVKQTHREFVSHTGYVGKKRVTVVSTGIGTDNIDIVLNELDALANINFNTRTINEKLTSLNIIRIGTCGGLQESINVDEFIASTHGIGIDNLINFYIPKYNEEEKQILQAFIQHTNLQSNLANPYIASASGSIIKHFVQNFHQGITITCPGFYGPQGRVLRLGLANPSFIDKLNSFAFGNHSITNFEMETSGIYGLGNLLNHNCLSLSVVVANRVKKEFSKDGNVAVEKLIKTTLEKIEGL